MSNYIFMISSYLLLLFLAVMSSFPITPTTSDDNDVNYLNSICKISDRQIDNTTIYMQSRKVLLDQFATDANDPKFDGFIEYQNSSSLINGLALCRGDIPTEECKVCLANATSEILAGECNLQTLIIFRSQCLIKYSNVDFFGQVDTDNVYYYCREIGSNQTYPSLDGDFANDQIKDAVANENMFANGTQYIYDVDVVVQCTRDLVADNCRACLKAVAAELARKCQNSPGGEYYFGSCFITYEFSRE